MGKKVLLLGVNSDCGKILFRNLVENSDISLSVVSRNKESDEVIKSLSNGREIKVFPSVLDAGNANLAVEGQDFVVNLDVMTAPECIHNPDEAERINYFTTKNLVDAIRSSNNSPKFIELSSMAVYGSHTLAHPYARVGDPVMPALYDIFGVTIARAERYLVENGNNFLVLRTSAIWGDGTLNKLLLDGALFQNPLNSPFDFVSAEEVAELIYKIILDDKVKYNNIYNFGSPEKLTMADAVLNSLRVLKISENILRANWFSVRNGNMAWCKDNTLRNTYKTTSMSLERYVVLQNEKYGYSKLLGALAFLVKKIIYQKVQLMKDAPLYWMEHARTKRVEVFYKGYDNFNRIPDSISEMRKYADGKELPISVQFDESGFVTEDQLKKSAEIRGGELVSKDYKTGDIHAKYNWKCAEGHNFKMTPYGVMVGGYWCGDCMPAPWNYKSLCEKSKYHSGIYYDEWDKNEEIIVTADDYHDIERSDTLIEFSVTNDKIKKYPRG